ncbi:hypothetical protein [Halorussus ruber]|uniref:hypothetical protein n=1 Tax=Halorussus ruber TaxID=1126238 RepID=UPI001092ED2B|nr:hypothetical protein [Halorussus ruber]
MDLKWQRIRDPIYAGGLGLTLLLVLAVVILLYLYLSGILDSAEARVTLGALSGLGTLFLAAGTFLSLWQNEREVDDLRKEREKPIVVDELQNFVQPAIETIESDIEGLEQKDRDIDWHYLKKSSAPLSDRLPRSVYHRYWRDEEQDITAIKRFREEAPDIWELIQRREETIEEAIGISNEIEDKIRTPITEYIQKNGIRNREEETPDIDPLLNAILKETDSYGESHADYEVWENHRDDFIKILHEEAGADYEQLREKEAEIQEMTRELKQRLLSRKIALREEYGISSDEIKEADVPRAV